MTFLKLKKERINELNLEIKDDEYDQQLNRIKENFKARRREFKKFVEKQKENTNNYLENSTYWDKLLEALSEHERCLEQMHENVISDIDLLKVLLVSKAFISESEILHSLNNSGKFDSEFIIF